MFLTAIFTMLTPLCARTNVYLLVAVRVLEGLFEVNVLIHNNFLMVVATYAFCCDSTLQLCFMLYHLITPGPEVIKLFSCSAQLRKKFILLINVKMLTILHFTSRTNDWL